LEDFVAVGALESACSRKPVMQRLTYSAGVWD